MRVAIVLVVVCAAHGARADDAVIAESVAAATSPLVPCKGTDVVGYRACAPFGSWGINLRLPYFTIELGTNLREFPDLDPSPLIVARSVTTPPHAVRGSDVAITTSMRFTVGITHTWYAGFETEIGELVAGGEGEFVGGYGLVGVRHGTKHVTFTLEGASGFHGVTYHETQTDIGMAGAVEARARAEVWLSPAITIGATLGASVLERDDWVAGVHVAFHSRAFGGTRGH